MKANIDLSGNYVKSGARIILNSASFLLIKKRKNPDLLKAQNYLVFETNGKQSYCSSLYPTDKESTFNADYAGVKYVLTFSDSRVLVRHREVRK
jgi:hypothetical protein